MSVQRAPSRRTTSRLPASADLELAENGGSWFEEATDHVAARPEHRGVELGPVARLPAAVLEPGILGWRRPLRGAGRGARPSAALYYLVGRLGSTHRGPSPVREFDWAEFVAIVPCPRPVPAVVLAQGPARRKATLARLARDAARELGDIDD